MLPTGAWVERGLEGWRKGWVDGGREGGRGEGEGENFHTEYQDFQVLSRLKGV